ncbi:hypothetical protein F4802DRAFT_581567 [Xylaria palmicola]|nr:hypothetical protein F4802DRAFT_581567 [Xylaria palmicola]
MGAPASFGSFSSFLVFSSSSFLSFSQVLVYPFSQYVPIFTESFLCTVPSSGVVIPLHVRYRRST